MRMEICYTTCGKYRLTYSNFFYRVEVRGGTGWLHSMSTRDRKHAVAMMEAMSAAHRAA